MRRVDMRLYDEDMIEKINDIAVKLDKSFPAVCFQLCKENLDKLYDKEVENTSSSEYLIQDIAQITKESAREVINGMKNVEITSQIHTKLLCTIYNVLVQLSSGDIVDKVAIEGGVHDDLPERFDEMLDLLIAKKKGENYGDRK